MTEQFTIGGAGYIDVCSIDGDWQAVFRQGADVVCLKDGLQKWFVAGVDILQIRCASDDAGKVLAVGQQHQSGQLVLIHEGRVIEGDWGLAFGEHSCAVEFDGLRWHVWSMESSTSLVHRVLQRDTIQQLSIQRQTVPETSQGVLYLRDGLAFLTDLNRTLKDAQGRVALTLPNPVKSFLALQEDTGNHLWIGQGGQGLAAFDAETNVLQTILASDAREPHIARLGPQEFVACCRSVRGNESDALIAVFTIPLVADVETDLPVNDPGRPFSIGLFHHHYRRELHPLWGTLTVPAALDVVTDPIAPVRPSLIGPDAVAHAPNDTRLVQGLFIAAEDGGPELVEREVVRARERWSNHHPGADIPPVVVYLTEGQRIAYGTQWATATSADIWAPECYLDLSFPADVELAIARELFAWRAALGASRPLLPVCQAFDRNGEHASHMATLAHALPHYLQKAQAIQPVKGLLFFDCNRSGLTNYPNVKRQYERIVAVCTPPQQLHPWTSQTPAPPKIAVRADKTTVRDDEALTVTVELLPGSGPVHAGVNWLLDTIGDGEGPAVVDATNEFTLRLIIDTPGLYRILAKVRGPGGEDTSDESDSPLITVLEVEEPEMPFPSDQEQHDALVQIHHQGYINFLGRPEGIFTTTGGDSDLVSPANPDKRVDAVGLAVWQGRYTQIFATTPGNPQPTRHDYAMRRALRGIWESGEAQNNPNRPPWPWEDPQ